MNRSQSQSSSLSSPLARSRVTVVVVAILVLMALAVGPIGARPLPIRSDEFTLSNTLGNHMVLQRAPATARVWGWTTTAAVDVIVVDVVRGNVSVVELRVTADRQAGGYWEAFLPPMDAGGPYEISFTSLAQNQSIEIVDVYFGDVFLCGGQSNMEMVVSAAFNNTAEIAAADEFPLIRLMTVGQGSISYTPLHHLGSIEQPWTVASSQSIGGDSWTFFSATCWFFGRDVFRVLGGTVPIGLVSSNWGGTVIEAWSSPDALRACNGSIDTPDGIDAADAIVDDEREIDGGSRGSQSRENPNQPSVLWNAMIAPFLPMSMAGVVWYQGESNVGHDDLYACRFPALIEDWRNKFTHLHMFFGFVQLAPWVGAGNDQIGLMRVAQLAALNLPNTEMASAVDLGDLHSRLGVIHPRFKQTVGFRLTLGALKVVYGHQIQPLGPMATGLSHVASGQVMVTFDPTTVGSGGLVSRNASCPTVLDPKMCAGYVVVFYDGATAVPYQVTIAKTYIVLSFEETVSSVQQVRYGISDWPIITLYNSEGLPASPFVLNMN